MAATKVAAKTRGRDQDYFGARRVSFIRLQLDNSYTTGGYAFDPKQFGHNGAVDRIAIDPRFSSGATGPTGKAYLYDYTNKKVVITVHASGAEAANASDQSGTVLDILVFSD